MNDVYEYDRIELGITTAFISRKCLEPEKVAGTDMARKGS
jgi:hypothetical protein